jgi:hypothetical protein
MLVWSPDVYVRVDDHCGKSAVCVLFVELAHERYRSAPQVLYLQLI